MTLRARQIRLVMGLRRAGIVDTGVLSAVERIPRELFVPPVFAAHAYENRALPIGEGQSITEPLIVARMTQALAIKRHHKVLEIGTGSGYQTAILAMLARRIYTIERIPTLRREAEVRLADIGIRNVTAMDGDGALGWPQQAPFERIIVTAGAVSLPPALLAQLAPGGVMVLPLGPGPEPQRMVRILHGESGLEWSDIGAAPFVPLLAGLAISGPDTGPRGP